MDFERLDKQVRFIVEIDRLKSISRKTILMDRSRRENSAEHSWHIALMALILAEYADDPDMDVFHAVKMLLVHDLVEIDAGDTYCYDDAGLQDKEERESRAADRIFNLLPQDQAQEFRSLWDEFEARRTAEARFAGALDRMQPLLNNYHTAGEVWRENGVRSGQVLERNAVMEEGAPELWSYMRKIIQDAVERGMLPQ